MNFIGLSTFVSREIGRMFRVWVQTLVTPWISALLYIFVFGEIVGSRIGDFAGVSYIDFVLPGLVMMNIIGSSFAHASSSVYFMKWIRSIDEILVAPLSYLEMILGFVIGGIVRGLVVGIGVYIVALLFTAATIDHLALFLLYSMSIAAVFSLLGMLVGLWAKSFEQLSLLNTFIIMPLTFLGGVFNSIHMLPEVMQKFTLINPFFYFVDGLRFAMIGIRESNVMGGAILIAVLVFGLGTLVWYLFKIGYRIKD
ncbi:MAG: ABC transporter permease [bacterium]|nr:ABC transporter permease [bacterium]